MGERFRAAAVASTSAASFAVIIAAANSINPLLPLLRAHAGLEPLALSLTFVFYVSAAIVTLATIAGRRRPPSPGFALIIALLFCVVANISLAGGTEVLILVGRALTGVAVGLATGAAAALVVDALRGRGRGLAATGNLVGAVLGTAAAQPFAAIGTIDAATALFLGLAAIAGALAVALGVALLVRGSPLNDVDSPGEVMPRRRARLGARGARTVAGAAVAWVALAAAVVYAPTVFFDASMPLAQVLATVIMLIASAAAQLGSAALARFVPRMSGLLILAAGIAAVTLAVVARADGAAVVAMAVIGVGGATAYRTALVALTAGAGPMRQGALASSFAVMTYSASALAVLAVGAFGAWWTTEAVLVVLCGVLVVLCAYLARRAPRVGAL